MRVVAEPAAYGCLLARFLGQLGLEGDQFLKCVEVGGLDLPVFAHQQHFGPEGLLILDEFDYGFEVAAEDRANIFDDFVQDRRTLYHF